MIRDYLGEGCASKACTTLLLQVTALIHSFQAGLHSAGESREKSQGAEVEESADVSIVWGKQETGSAWVQAVTEVGAHFASHPCSVPGCMTGSHKLRNTLKHCHPVDQVF